MDETALDKNRQMIDEIDRDITLLFEKRLRIVSDILDYKLEHHIPILDSGREKDIRIRNAALIEDDLIQDQFVIFYDNLLAISKAYQEELLSRK